jgi:hypothetical protein
VLLLFVVGAQEDGDELRRSLQGVGENMDQLEADGLKWHEVAWRGVAWLGAVRCGAVRCGAVRCGGGSGSMV